MENVQDLNSRLGIPGVAEIVAGNGGLAAVRVGGTGGGIVYLQGAHLASWTGKNHIEGGEEVLWLSRKSHWEASKAIRGGVPVCFPWFGPRQANQPGPAHGFARLRSWALESIARSVDGVTVTLALAADEATRELWPHDFLLRHRITFGPELIMALELTNTGKEPLTAEMALHTYFSVGDARQVVLQGLTGRRYIDKVDALKEKVQEGPIRFTGETDRVYLATADFVEIADPVKGRQITVAKEGSQNTVVWNPWIAKAKAMPDFDDEEWPQMTCVETANVGASAVELAPGGTHIMKARIQVAKL